MAVKDGVYRGMSAPERNAERRTRLLAATLAVWGRADGERVTMTGICAEAGLTERYFYEQFAGLDEALRAVMDQIAAEIAAATADALATATGDPATRVRAAIGAFVQILTEDPRKGRVAIIASAAHDVVRVHRSEMLRQFAQTAARDADRLYGPDALGAREGEMAGLMFVGGVSEMVTAWLSGTLEATPEEIIEAATRQFTATAHR